MAVEGDTNATGTTDAALTAGVTNDAGATGDAGAGKTGVTTEEATAALYDKTDGTDKGTTDKSTTEPGKTEGTDADKSDAGKAADKEGVKTDADKTDKTDKDDKDDKDGKKGEDEKGAPEKYEDFKLPEGYKLNPATLDKFSGLAKEMNLPQAQAQKFLDLAASQVVDAAKAQEAAFNDIRTGWVSELKSDEEFGGAKFDTTIEAANKAYARFGSAELVEFLDKGYGDHPALVKAFARINAAISEDTTVTDGKPPAQTAKTAAQVMYGS